jgi:ABC-2 type transport system permease protein
MSTQSNTMSESFQAQNVVPAAMPASRVFYWSVRRELWENRSIYMAPVAVAAVILVAFSISSTLGIWESRLRLVPSRPQMPYDMAAGALMLTGIIVSVFYCLDALHSERRDRSILFWKSLPVSDVTTVLAKASIPLIVVPLLTFAIAIAMQWMMLLVSSAVLLISGQSVATLWRSLPLASMWLLMLYHIITAHAIWPFPVYCWLLLVSGWARRATFLWAALPLVAIAAVEGIVFRTRYFAELIGRRFIGDAPAMNMAPDSMGLDPLTTHLTVGRFLTSPGLWVGFAIAALFLAAAVRVRRHQGPI